MGNSDHPLAPAQSLARVLTFWPLVFYGLGVIVGAGIYVALGTVIGRAGDAAPFSFLLAGIAAGLTGLCYAELASRFPEAAGAASYVQKGFRSDRLAQLTGAALTIAVAVSAASIARGAVHYLTILVPVSQNLLTAALVGGFTAIAVIGVWESVGLAALLGVIEIGGLVIATIVGFQAAPSLDFRGLVPMDSAAWHGVIAGAFIAFFAFIGFETLANLAEEVRDAQRTVPRAMLGALAASMVLYIAVASAAVLSDKTGGLPLLDLFEGKGATIFAGLAFLAVSNGVLIEIVMLARLFYGMARNGQLPASLGHVYQRTRTPVLATLTAGMIVLVVALLVPFERLLVFANALTLFLFALVDLALWRIKFRRPVPRADFEVWSWVPPAASVLTTLLILAEVLQ